jgi:hypothetical protein
MKDEGFSPSKIKQEWLDHGIIVSNDKKRPGTHRIIREKNNFVGIRIIRSTAEELIGLNYDNIDEDDLQLDEK